MYVDRVVVATCSRVHMHVQLMLPMVEVVVGFLIEPVGVLGRNDIGVVVFLFMFVLKSTLAPIKSIC